MRVHPSLLLGAALLALSFNDTLVYAIGEMSAIQDRLLRPVVGVLALVLPGLALFAYGALFGGRRGARGAPATDES